MTLLHHSTFQYLKPTEAQFKLMDRLRTSSAIYASLLDVELPEGPDKTYILRSLRSIAMWVNVAITRQADGTPRD
jgi:hypothetical protein